MQGVSIRYQYSGDEGDWESKVDAFISAVNSDPDLAGKFHYEVNKAVDGNMRVHHGRWDSDETLATLQSRDYFKLFAGQIKEMGGESLSAFRIEKYTSTNS